VSPTSGGAGETTVTFSAPAGEGRTAEVIIMCGTKKQRINVIQGLATVSTATCKEVLAGPDSKTFRVTGVCTGIANTTYGNWYLNDGTGEVYIYGTLDAKGNTKNFLSLGLEVGDEVTVEGPKTTYNGTVELVDVTVIKINKSLIKVESTDPADATIGKDGGELTIQLSNKGNTLAVEIPEAAKSWLGISGLNGNEVVFYASPNEGGDRQTDVVFKTNDGKKDYTATATIYQKGAIIACSVAEFLAAPVSTVQYRLKGVITSVANKSYGNIYLKDFSGEVYVYGIGSKGDFEKLGLKEGDIVTLVGQRGEHSGSAQMAKGQYESHIAVATVTVAEFLAAAESKDVWYRVTGKVTKPTEEGTKWDIETYGNLNLTDDSGSVYVYGVSTGVGGESKKFSTLGVKEGDKMTIIGYRTSYNGLNQVGGGMYVSHEAAQEGGEGGEGGEVAAGNYVKVSAAPSSWAGKYLIVWDGEAHATPSNKDLAKTADVTIAEGVIASSDAVNAAAVTVAAMEGGYSIALPNGQFLTFNTDGNQCTFADAAAPMSFEFAEAGIKITGVDASGNTRYLMQNPNNGNAIYRGYKATSIKDDWAYPTLYKFVEAQ
jgi:formylmethanofuran dehydrogenase subunit D